MKAATGIAAAVLLGGLGFYLLKPAQPPGGAMPPALSVDPPTSTLNDPVEVFQKAFWKRPGTNDKILHAERREWADGQGVKRWQWFIAVEPSPELVRHLREDNAFSLVPAAAVPPIPDAPAWFGFQTGEFEAFHAPRGNMRVLFSTTKPLLLATDSGGGFQSGVPEEAPPGQKGQTTSGRIPLASPPTSR
jgi:hypothetical protein